ncbi:cytoskeleton-associated protein 2-like isoform X1 [Microtus oregoni]|uniref:cytoskeleton-associated protein 2-like isoform X1 n=1 Tax=Microtus oregoni TaxID=111838 RepID=UPI001BB14650|nr:cytoskeleton-associated protein 2-like isoform X1 [Microtus oregoni]
MVGPGPTASAAAEERWRKLQEYLAAKGKLKDPNTKPYLKAKNICPKPPSSKYTPGPKKDVSSHAVLPVRTTRPINIKLQTKPASITGSQKPELEPRKLADKGLTSRCFSSNSDYKQSSKSQPQHRATSSTTGLPSKPRRFPGTQDLEPKRQQLAHQGTADCTDPAARTSVKNQSLKGFRDEMNKENLLEPGKPDPNLHPRSKPNTGSYNQSQKSLAPKQILSKSSVNHTILKDRANKQVVRNTQVRAHPVKSQHLSTDADSARPREKAPRTVPPPFIPAHNKTQTSKKPVVKDTQDAKVSRIKCGRPTETTVQPHPATERKVKHTKPGSHPSLLQGGQNNRQPPIKQDQKAVQPCLGPRTSCILQKSRAISQRPNLTAGNFNSVTLSTPSIGANKTHNHKCNSIFQQKAQTLDFKLKKVLPQSQFLSKTAPKTQAGMSAASRRGAPSTSHIRPCVKKTQGEDRRKQLEEWQKSKGKTYKRPPMKFKAKRKVIEEMNISFWKSMEREAEEEEEKKAQLELTSKINNTLTECLRLIEEGVFPNEIFTILSSIPEAEKFPKFWVCKAKLLASKGPFDATGLYEEAIKHGAAPTQELREVLSRLQDSSRSTEAVTSDSLAAGTNVTSVDEPAEKEECGQSCLSLTEGEQVTTAPPIPPITAAEWDNPGIKLQIAAVPKICGMPEMQDMKLITPVRRSARIEQAVARYPEMLQDHDVVVASLNELLEVDKTEYFVFRENEALPVTLGFEILES